MPVILGIASGPLSPPGSNAPESPQQWLHDSGEDLERGCTDSFTIAISGAKPMGTLVALEHAASSAKEVVTLTHVIHGRVGAIVSRVKPDLHVGSFSSRVNTYDAVRCVPVLSASLRFDNHHEEKDESGHQTNPPWICLQQIMQPMVMIPSI